MRKSLSRKSGGTAIKRHNGAVNVEITIEREADWVAATEVSHL